MSCEDLLEDGILYTFCVDCSCALERRTPAVWWRDVILLFVVVVPCWVVRPRRRRVNVSFRPLFRRITADTWPAMTQCLRLIRPPAQSTRDKAPAGRYDSKPEWEPVLRLRASASALKHNSSAMMNSVAPSRDQQTKPKVYCWLCKTKK